MDNKLKEKCVKCREKKYDNSFPLRRKSAVIGTTETAQNQIIETKNF